MMTDRNGTVIALGTFDGVHIGHRALISKAVSAAREMRAQAMVYTFARHPAEAFGRSTAQIMDNSDRLCLLEQLAGRVEADEFDASFAAISPEDFIKSLISRFSMRAAVAGFNYTFGKGGDGTRGTLVELGMKLGFDVYVIPPVIYGGEAASSTRIREAVTNGDMELAGAMLTAPYSISGNVVANRHIGTSIGFPTANIAVPANRAIPRHGVYVTRAVTGGDAYPAITNIGTNPTVGGSSVTIETHMLNFCGDIYGQPLKVEFLSYLRGDMRFDSVDCLREQIARDRSAAEAYFGELSHASAPQNP